MPLALQTVPTAFPALAADRRHEERVGQCRTVRAFDPAAGRSLVGTTRDVSRSGLCAEFAGPATLRVGQSLTVHVTPTRRLGDLSGHRLLAARVAWIAPIAGEPGAVAVGLELASGVPAARPARLAA